MTNNPGISFLLEAKREKRKDQGKIEKARLGVGYWGRGGRSGGGVEGGRRKTEGAPKRQERFSSDAAAIFRRVFLVEQTAAAFFLSFFLSSAVRMQARVVLQQGRLGPDCLA